MWKHLLGYFVTFTRVKHIWWKLLVRITWRLKSHQTSLKTTAVSGWFHGRIQMGSTVSTVPTCQSNDVLAYGPGRNVPQTLHYYLGECGHSQWTSSSLSNCLRTLTTWGWEIMVTVKRVPGSFATSVTRVHVSVWGLYNMKRLEVTVLVICWYGKQIELKCCWSAVALWNHVNKLLLHSRLSVASILSYVFLWCSIKQMFCQSTNIIILF